MMANLVQRQPITHGEARILVVEDKVDSYTIVARLLAYSGVHPPNCEWKSSGGGVIQFADLLRHLDLILLDISLPFEDGYEVLAQLRGKERFRDTLIVAVTGHATAEEMRKAQIAGFDGFLAKPLQVDRFPDQLSRILRGEQVWECR